MMWGIAITLLVAFTSSIIISFIAYSFPTLAFILLVSLMFMPTVDVLIACKVTGDTPIKYGLSDLKIESCRKSNMSEIFMLIVKTYESAFTKKMYTVIALTYPYFLALTNLLLYLILHGSLPSIADIIMTLTLGQIPKQLTPVLLIMYVLGVFINSIVGFLPALGEEICWRGYLLGNLAEEIGIFKATLLTGVIWSLWHTPLILILGYDYGIRYPDPRSFMAVLVFTVFCILLGTFFTWLRYRSSTVTIPALAHASFNGSGGLLLISFWNKDMLNAGLVGWPIIVSLIILLAFISVLELIMRKDLDKWQ